MAEPKFDYGDRVNVPMIIKGVVEPVGPQEPEAGPQRQLQYHVEFDPPEGTNPVIRQCAKMICREDGAAVLVIQAEKADAMFTAREDDDGDSN